MTEQAEAPMTELVEWVSTVAAELGVEPPADLAALLDLARRAAHGVDRPAAPLTAFVVGVAVGSGTPAADAIGRAGALADGWAERTTTAGDGRGD
jgi:hypothetical protein